MEITFYSAPMSSAIPVAAALAELGVPHRTVSFDLTKDDHRGPDYAKVNPNAKVPALVVDGAPMFEATAIMQFLGATFGVEKQLWPAPGTPARPAAHAWATWAYVEYAPVIRQLFLATSDSAPPELKSQAWADHARGAAQRLLGILDGQLAATGFVVTERYSLVDLIVSCAVMWSQTQGVLVADHPHVSRWLQTCAERPAIKQAWR